MPIADFSGLTFVAFADIAGFKKLMKSRTRAMEALCNFYSNGYDILGSQKPDAPNRVEGLFLSDCAVLFVRHNHADAPAQLRAVLSVVQSINRKMLQYDLMLSTAIAYGHFDYNSRKEFAGIEKNLIHGDPYLDAYLDQSSGTPKLYPGQCRILHKRIPPCKLPLPHDDEYFSRLRSESSHSYFYWMCSGADEIEAFNFQYRSAESLKGDHKFAGMLKALKQPTRNTPHSPCVSA